MKHIEPVSKHKNTSCSILVFRNDTKVVRFRLSPFWIKFLVIFFVLFSGASGAAGYAAHYYWKKYNTLQQVRSELTEKLGENIRQLSEFANIEKIKQRQPRSSMAGIAPVGGENGSPAPEESRPEELPPEVPLSPAEVRTTPPSAGEGSRSVPLAEADTAPRQESANPAGNVGPNGENPVPGQAEHPAGIDNVRIRHATDKTYKLTYELSNRERGREIEREQYLTLNGKVHIAVADKSGERHAVTAVNGDSLRFVIKWGKKVDVTFSLPSSIPTENVELLLLTVEGDDFPAITYPFPMPHPQNS